MIEHTEMDKLVIGLAARNMKYDIRLLHGGFQVLVFDNKGQYDWDAVCHNFSYGHEDGLLEIMGSLVPETEEVIGYLTADEIFNMIDCERK